MRFFFIIACLFEVLWAAVPGTMTLINDSPYILTASVYTSSGDFLGQVTLQPGEQKNFTSNLSSAQLKRPGYPDVSSTPYRVIWTCANGGVYSMARDGSAGATLRASDCPGAQYCAPKPDPK